MSSSNPARKPEKTVPKYLTEGEIEAFFHAIHSARDRALFRIIYHRGLRASAPGLMNLADYHESPGRPPVAQLECRRLKGSRSRAYELTEIEHAAMRAWIRERGLGPGPLFLSRGR
jgi:integrase